ncbi:uncharacterized protein TRIADDRAFT_57573 [Trichoplax adhaerens]|uniref:VWFA domain-containing protein n=1 Tax=Trichoplax adhaerens TaxID=10228 RepID=B3RZT7_TRIAD|nr:hypothetical protein TRIADDRAFT_57573 [Trichoplax adhaerens]EDV23896.1 hypothetical protein TRIADDRAFT_57573 [Trichoplax adhaerens]|eukprot:XP_002113422.1 hypothetical protein TRIADDRAFT_57573 [Trichoplax adhaerens]
MARFYIILAVLLSCGLHHALGSARLINNGYEDVVIAISNSVSERQFPNLLDQIQRIFTESSSRLYTAFRRRAYFRYITIVIPRSWEDNAKYEPATKQSFHTADFRIDHDTVSINGKCSGRALVRTIGGYQCGKSNDYIEMTPNSFCPSNGAFPFLGKNIVRQWARYRYGIYDEESKGSKLLYRDHEENRFKPIQCSRSLKVHIVDMYNKTCSYNPVSGSGLKVGCRIVVARSSLAAGSIMYEYRVDGIEHFCDDGGKDAANARTRHNPIPSTYQNIYCDSKSVWTVIKRHPDFVNDKNPPANIRSTIPKFRFVKSEPLRIAMVLDKSGSMSGRNMQLLSQAAINVIAQSRNFDGKLGIVTFSTNATVTCPLTAGESDQEKNKLINCLPSEAEGETSIGSGILKGIELLRKSKDGRKPSGGHLIVMSDGQENYRPYIENIMTNITENEIVITSISLGQHASENLEDLSKLTGGLSYFASTNSTLTLINAFTTIVSNLVGPDNIKYTTPIQIYSEEVIARPGKSYRDSALLDRSIGDNAQFTFTWELRQINVILTSPLGINYTSTSPEYTVYKQQKLIRITIAKAQSGRWKYTIEDKLSRQMRDLRAIDQSQSVSVTVSALSKAQSSNNESIAAKGVVTIEVKLNKEKIQYPDVPIVYVEVKLGHLAVLNCSAVVKVTVPNQSKNYILRVRDDGAGADITANDGIYSAYMTKLDGNGRYALLGMVNANANQSYIDTNYNFGARNTIDNQADIKNSSSARQIEYVYAFSRVKSGPLLEVSHYSLGTDQLPPARIHDLLAIETISKNKSVILKWTATGNDLDQGTAEGYEIRYASTSLELEQFRNNFATGQIASFQSLLATPNATNVTKPKPAGSTEEMIVALDEVKYGRTYMIGLIAYDKSLQSKVSNYVYGVFQHVFQPFQFQIKIEHHHLGILKISWKTACSSCTNSIGK